MKINICTYGNGLIIVLCVQLRFNKIQQYYDWGWLWTVYYYLLCSWVCRRNVLIIIIIIFNYYYGKLISSDLRPFTVKSCFLAFGVDFYSQKWFLMTSFYFLLICKILTLFFWSDIMSSNRMDIFLGNIEQSWINIIIVIIIISYWCSII